MKNQQVILLFSICPHRCFHVFLGSFDFGGSSVWKFFPLQALGSATLCTIDSINSNDIFSQVMQRSQCFKRPFNGQPGTLLNRLSLQKTDPFKSIPLTSHTHLCLYPPQFKIDRGQPKSIRLIKSPQ